MIGRKRKREKEVAVAQVRARRLDTYKEITEFTCRGFYLMERSYNYILLGLGERVLGKRSSLVRYSPLMLPCLLPYPSLLSIPNTYFMSH